MNPRGQFPVLVDEDSIVYDSHAILVYLALKYYNSNWYSNNPYEVALIQEWLSFSANEIHNSLNLARLKYKFDANVDWDLAKQKSILVLGILDQHLDRRDWLELSKPTIADIACFPYVALANEGKIDTSQYKNIIKWIIILKNCQDI
jgi:glutathione S-transferase